MRAEDSVADHPLFTHNYFSFMKLWGILFLVVPLLGGAYVFWRSWQLMPFCSLAKTIILLLMALALMLIYVTFSGSIDKLPMWLAATVYQVSMSWLIILFCTFEQTEKVSGCFLLRGHINYRQVYPALWMKDDVCEKAYSDLRKSRVRWRFATSGLGIWGGKFRIGTQSEYLVVTLTPTVSVN